MKVRELSISFFLRPISTRHSRNDDQLLFPKNEDGTECSVPTIAGFTAGGGKVPQKGRLQRRRKMRSKQRRG
jgi:hypothetical protein